MRFVLALLSFGLTVLSLGKKSQAYQKTRNLSVQKVPEQPVRLRKILSKILCVTFFHSLYLHFNKIKANRFVPFKKPSSSSGVQWRPSTLSHNNFDLRLSAHSQFDSLYAVIDFAFGTVFISSKIKAKHSKCLLCVCARIRASSTQDRELTLNRARINQLYGKGSQADNKLSTVISGKLD